MRRPASTQSELSASREAVDWLAKYSSGQDPQPSRYKCIDPRGYMDLPTELHHIILDYTDISLNDIKNVRLTNSHLRHAVAGVLFKESTIRFGPPVMDKYYLDQHGRPIKPRKVRKKARPPKPTGAGERLQRDVFNENVDSAEFLSCIRQLNFSALYRLDGQEEFSNKATVLKIRERMTHLRVIHVHVNVNGRPSDGILGSHAKVLLNNFCSKLFEGVETNVTISGISGDRRMLGKLRSVHSVRLFAGNIRCMTELYEDVIGVLVNNPNLKALHVSAKSFSLDDALGMVPKKKHKMFPSLTRLRLDYVPPFMKSLDRFPKLEELELNLLDEGRNAMEDIWKDLRARSVQLIGLSTWIVQSRKLFEYISFASTTLRRVQIRPNYNTTDVDLAPMFWSEVLPRLQEKLEILGIDIVGHTVYNQLLPSLTLIRRWQISNAVNISFKKLKELVCPLVYDDLGYNSFIRFVDSIYDAPNLCMMKLSVFFKRMLEWDFQEAAGFLQEIGEWRADVPSFKWRDQADLSVDMQPSTHFNSESFNGKWCLKGEYEYRKNEKRFIELSVRRREEEKVAEAAEIVEVVETTEAVEAVEEMVTDALVVNMHETGSSSGEEEEGNVSDEAVLQQLESHRQSSTMVRYPSSLNDILGQEGLLRRGG